MDVYETENSRYEIDLPARRYRRTPLPHGIMQEMSDRLKYGDWLPLKDIPTPVKLVDTPDMFTPPERRLYSLHIMHEDSTYGILTSPIVSMAIGVDVPLDVAS